MTDKMMRIAGRGEDGLAKAVITDNEGRIITKQNHKRQVFDTTTLDNGESVRSYKLNHLGYLYGKLVLRFPSKRELKITLIDIVDGAEQRRVVFEGVADNSVTVEYEILSDEYYVEVEATSDYGLTVRNSSFEVLLNEPSTAELIDANPNHKRHIFQRTTITEGQVVRSYQLESLGYNHGRLVLRFPSERSLRVSIVDVVDGDELPPRVVFDGSGERFVIVEYEITSDNYYVEVEATSEQGLQVRHSSFETLSNVQRTLVTNKNEYQKRHIFQTTTITEGQVVRSYQLESLGYDHGRLVLRFPAERSLRVSIVDVVEGDELPPRVVFDGSGERLVIVEYGITSDNYYVEVEATSAYGLQVQNSSFETLSHVQRTFVTNKNEYQMTNKNEYQRPTKYPTSQLVFKDLPLDLQTLTQGTDGYFYGVDRDGVINKYDNIVEPSEPLESGITWNSALNGSLIYLFIVDDGVVFFSNYDNGLNTVTRIYRSDSIQDEPALVYEPSDAYIETIWERHFGVDHYYNGTSYFLAGAYGTGHHKRDLILSTDGGKTFKVVKQTANEDTSGNYNSHWHDVAIDHYHGLLWASEGDGPINRRVHYSEDMGENWKVISTSMQPTSITPYPDKVVLGRDSGRVGLDVIHIPENISNLRPNDVQELRAFKSQQSAYYFAMKPITYKNETYMNFFLYGDGHSPMIVASGDLGESWHGVWISMDRREMYNFTAIDDKYVYAYKSTGADGNIAYAEKPNWE